MPVCLWMLERLVMVQYAIIGIELSKHWSIKLTPIVADKYLGNSELANNVHFYKVLHLLFCDRCQQLGFGLLCEIVYSITANRTWPFLVGRGPMMLIPY